jgi:hypothetical protein
MFRMVNWWSGGAYEAFLERMLLGVVMVRDVVEKSRWGFWEGGGIVFVVTGPLAATCKSTGFRRHTASSIGDVIGRVVGWWLADTPFSVMAGCLSMHPSVSKALAWHLC